jgi:hypothetical protein
MEQDSIDDNELASTLSRKGIFDLNYINFVQNKLREVTKDERERKEG